ncbi:MAG: dockerin type I domain-containing protein [Pirellulales bacterium]
MRNNSRLIRKPLPKRVPTFEQFEPRRPLAADLATIVERPTVNVTDFEQLLVEEVNRTRANPAATATRLGIDLNDGLDVEQRINIAAKSPLAIRQPLATAAAIHSQDMLDRDYFSHVSPDLPVASVPSSRALAQEYRNPVGENIAVRSVAIDLTLEVLATHDQLFHSPGHRANMLRDEYSDLGIGIRQGDFVFGNGRHLDSLLTTELFGIGNAAAITGVVYDDTVIDDDWYSIGEGLSGVVVEARASDGTIYRVHAGTSGGYTLDVPNGVYTINATGGGLAHAVTIPNVQVAGKNVKLDITPASTTSPNREEDGGTPPTLDEIRALDVSGDGQITPRDALLILNHLIEERTGYDRSLDATGDGIISPLDALNVVNYLNRYGNGTFVPSQVTLGTSPSLVSPANAAAPAVPRDAAEVVAAAMMDLSARTGVARDRIDLESVAEVESPDAGLELTEPGIASATVIAPGYRIVLTIGTRQFEYRTDLSNKEPSLLTQSSTGSAEVDTVFAQGV